MEIVGFGVRIAAEAGTRINRVPDRGENLVSAWSNGNGPTNAMIAVGSGEAQLMRDAGNGTGGLAMITEPAAAQRYWSVSDGDLTCAWPPGVTAWAADRPADGWDTEFHGPGQALIVLRGPMRGADQVPTPDRLVRPGQTVIDSDMSAEQMWIELGGEHNGVRWRQRHQYAVIAPETVVIVTGQAVDGEHAVICQAVHVIARSLRYR